MACHHRPKAPAFLKAWQTCFYMVPRARHVPGTMPSSNARASTTAWGDEIKRLIVIDAHPRDGPPPEATQLQEDLCHRRPCRALLAGQIPKAAGWAQASCHAMASTRRQPAHSR